MSKSSEEGAGGNAPAQDASGGNGAQKDANGNIYENRAGTKKIIRVVTVMAYVFSVSFAAILLSGYYVFLWEPPNPRMIQRHPLTSDPRVEYLTDDSLRNSNLYKPNASGDRSIVRAEIKNPIANFNIFKGIMSPDQETSSNPRKLAALPKDLLAYEDFLEIHRKLNSSVNAIATSTTINDYVAKTPSPPTQSMDGNGVAGSSLTAGTMSTNHQLTREAGGRIGQNKFTDSEKKMNVSLANGTSSTFERTTKFGLWESFKIPTERNDRQRDESNGSNLSAVSATMNDEATSASSESSATTTTTIHPALSLKIDSYAYPVTTGDAGYNKVTIGNDATTDASTPQVPEFEDNPDDSLRKREPRLFQDPGDEGPTTTPEVQIHPDESARDILENRN